MFNKFFIPNTPEERKRNRRHLLLMFISGILMGLSFPPISLNFLMFIALVPLLIVFSERETLAEISRAMYLTMFIWTLITIYWVGSWTPEADPFLMLSGVLLMFANPAVYLIPSTLFYFTSKIYSKKTAYFMFPVFWVAWEYIFSIIDIKFPWLMLSNSQTNFLSFIQIADIIGAYGISVLIVLINVFMLFIYFEKKKGNFSLLYLSLLLLMFIVPLIYGFVSLANPVDENRKIKIGLIQPDLNPWEKWQAGNLQNQLDRYFIMSDSAITNGAELIVWPETALPVYLLSGNYPNEVTQIHNYCNSKRVAIITGMPYANFYSEKDKKPEDAKPLSDGKRFYTSYNSSLAFVPDKKVIQQYGKIKLVPFGERVPWLDLIPFLGDIFKWNVGISSWNIGTDTTVFNFQYDELNYKVGAVVCIETIYPDFIARFVDKGAELIVAVTNDSWYGNSSGPYQHKETSVLRAIENRRYIAQAANGGISYIINSNGEFIIQSKMFEKRVLTGEISFKDGKTFFTKYPLLIPFLSIAISIWVAGMFFIIKLKRRFKKN